MFRCDYTHFGVSYLLGRKALERENLILEREKAWKLGIACKIEGLWRTTQVFARIGAIEDSGYVIEP